MTALVMVGSEADAFIAQRRAAGLDARDEVWEGVYHVAPFASFRHSRVEHELHRLLDPLATSAGLILAGPLNVGDDAKDSYRIPDLTVSDPTVVDVDAVFVPTVLIAIEVLSPADETYEKFGFYAARGVDEILVADPAARTVCCWHLTGGEYVPAGASSVLQVACADLEAAVNWPI